MSGYETFPKGRHLLSSRGSELQVRCSNQRIVFNKSVRALLNDKSHVLLMWDKEARRVAVKPSSDDPEGYRISYSKSNAQCHITCMAFLKATGLQGIYKPIWNAEEEILEWNIDREVTDDRHD